MIIVNKQPNGRYIGILYENGRLEFRDSENVDIVIHCITLSYEQVKKSGFCWNKNELLLFQ